MKLETRYNKVIKHVEDCSCTLLVEFEDFIKFDISGKARTLMLRVMCECEHEAIYPYRKFSEIKKGKIVRCKECSKDEYTREKYRALLQNHKENKCEFLSPSEDDFITMFETTRTSQIIIRYRASCGHIQEETIYSFERKEKKKCTRCLHQDAKKIARDKKMNDKEAINEDFKKIYRRKCDSLEKENCEMLTNEEEFLKIVIRDENGMYKYHIAEMTVIRYKATCGDEHTITLRGFREGHGRICKECYNKDSRNEDGSSRSARIEDNAIMYMMDLLEGEFIIQKNFEGCLSDFLIKPVGVEEDSWLMVQQKTCSKMEFNKYKFGIKPYKNCMIMCLCLEDERMWIFDGNTVELKNGTQIVENDAKYEINEVDVDCIVEIINEYYERFPKYEFEETDMPISKTTRKEKEFYMLRKSKFEGTGIEFIKPFYSGLVYDFKIGNKKIQEKTGNFNKKNCLSYNLGKSDGHTKIPYVRGDNHFYWFHHPNEKYFFFIPEYVLYNERFIDGTRTHLVFSQNNTKYDEYLFDYDDIDLEKFNEMLNTDYSDRYDNSEDVIYEEGEEESEELE